MLIVEYLSKSYHRFLPDLAEHANLKSRFLITLNGPNSSELSAIIRDITRFTKKSVQVSTAISDKETNEGVGEIFQNAKISRDILLFSGADSLLEKRAGIRGSHDRDENFDLNDLQKNIANHNGIVILATEQKQILTSSMSSKVNVLIRFPVADK
ncbi:hypothetical protein Ping_2066 [Psychromonas ingrahamii 37]|uniref:Uncharacterized protein n=1 Tax=Psychromonas ingrahamii (strain DSM 17664 / CCUG 51855 / 37) TaxID=357804 RepID=A1SWF3_PSYIN|nr:hypothetical protein [Psychromonas ingrahamii]ABM03818.1 hypothetical protein Ping_2066 [Psychromonas ingrahamii 37]